MAIAADYTHMARALALARRGVYSTHPNPRVGCVIVRDGRVVGEGWHRRAGEPHAEILALQRAGEAAAGATAYVTLEPCCHQGRTGPCTSALAEAGVARVVAAMEDPNPSVRGRGLEQLRDAGIQVESGLSAAEAAALNAGFVKRMMTGRPFVRAKLAMSLDGRTAMASGESQWITGPDARRDVQRLRARSDAIMTGIGTVLADDPQLNVRAGLLGAPPHGGDWRQPMRVVVDPRLSTPATARILSAPGGVLIATTCDEEDVRDQLAAAGADIVRLPGSADQVDLAALLEHLGGLEVNEVLLETGATLGGAMLQAGLVDELVVYVAPVLMGDEARGLFRLPGLERLADRVELSVRDIRAVGADWRITAVPRT